MSLVADAPWLFVQSTGHLIRPNGTLCGVGYSGHGPGVNNHDMQAVSNVGPLPCGFYTIGAAVDHPMLGPVAMPLTPDGGTAMFGRGHFWIHGNNRTNDASLGCIIQGHPAREELAATANRRLRVIAEPLPVQQAA